jgi:hypothetical protein
MPGRLPPPREAGSGNLVAAAPLTGDVYLNSCHHTTSCRLSPLSHASYHRATTLSRAACGTSDLVSHRFYRKNGFIV